MAMRSAKELTLTSSERLAVARKRAGLSQSEMAVLLGIGRRSISRYENEDDPTEPIRAITIAWAYVTDAPLEWLEFGAISDAVGRGDFVQWENQLSMFGPDQDFTNQILRPGPELSLSW